VDTEFSAAYSLKMKIPLSPEAIERMANYDEWFLSEVQKGIAAAERGEVTDHDEVRKLIGERYPR
jgi:predicted transcriptional regulator